jgi:thiamine phosphate synthase YjbQ (UPF0047 family)
MQIQVLTHSESSLEYIYIISHQLLKTSAPKASHVLSSHSSTSVKANSAAPTLRYDLRQMKKVVPQKEQIFPEV